MTNVSGKFNVVSEYSDIDFQSNLKTNIWLIDKHQGSISRIMLWFWIRKLHESWDLTLWVKVRNGAKIRKRYNQVPHLTQDTTCESNKNTINITNKSQKVSPFPAGDHKAAMKRRKSMRNTRNKKHKWYTKEVPPWNGPLSRLNCCSFDDFIQQGNGKQYLLDWQWFRAIYYRTTY